MSGAHLTVIGSPLRRLFAFPASLIVPALALGVMAGLLPPPLSAVILAILALGLIVLIDPRIGLLVALTLAPLKTLIETESALQFQLPLDIGQITLLAALGAWLLQSVAQRRPVRWSALYFPLMGFLFAAALSLWTALSPGMAINELIKWLAMLLVMGMVGSLGGAWWAAAAVVVAAASQAILGLYQFAGGSGAPHLWILDYQHFRAFGGFGQPNPFGALMGLALPLALGGGYGMIMAAWNAWRAQNNAEMRLHLAAALCWLAGAAIIGAGLLASWSRGAWLGFGAAFLTLIVFAPRRRWIGALLAAGMAGVLWLSVITGLAPASLVARITDFAQDFTGLEDVRGRVINDDNYAVIERLAHWQAAIGMANDSPWLGQGFGNYEAAYPRYALVNWPMALGHAHNYYLNLLAETGVVGLAAYLIMGAAYVRLTLRCLRGTSGLRHGLALGLLGAWAHLFVHSLFDKLFVNNLFLHIGALLGLIVALLPAANRRGEKSHLD